MNIAITIDIVDNILKKYNYRLKELESVNIQFIKSMQESGHITLCVGEIEPNEIENFLEYVSSILENKKMFIIKTNGLGVFFNDDINLHIRWKINHELFVIRNILIDRLKSIWKENIEYNSSLNWVAKTSLAYKDIKLSDFSKFNFIKNDFINEEMKVKEISVVKFEFDKKERILKKYILNGD